MKMVEELKRLREEKEKKEKCKTKREAGKKDSVKSTKKNRTEENTSKEAPVAGPSKRESSDERMSVHDSSNKIINLGKDTFGNGITMDESEINSWVEVKLEKATSSSSRQSNLFDTYLARVIKVDGAGYEVSFLIEKCKISTSSQR